MASLPVKIVWTRFALADLKSIRTFIARDSAIYAKNFSQRILDAVTVLESFPQLGCIVPEFSKSYVVRERIVQSYRILYAIEKNRPVILAVVHSARELNSIKLPERN